MNKVSARYAEALLEIAIQKKRLNEFKAQAKMVSRLLNENPKFTQLFEKTQLSSVEKKTMLQTVFGSQIDEMLINLMCLLIDKKRVRMMPMILMDFVHLVNQNQSIEEGIVYSIRPLPESDITQLETELSLKHNVKVELVNKIDLSLISGLKIKFKESVIDASLSYQLESLRETLREGRS
jgi:F-type H+-transporting ATPase subunit delta